MVTIVLHDKDALEALSALKAVARYEARPAIQRTAEALSCALLLCDCDKAGKEKE